MERLFAMGIELISQLQNHFLDYHNVFEWLSYFGDPRIAYVIYFPLVYAFSQQCGLRVIISAAVSECANLLLKWILQEDRPYWYVNENKDQFAHLSLKQFPLTCETGPGSPSGHVMVSTAVWFVVVAALSKKLNLFFSVILKIIFFAVICLIAASRMFISAHFPHQCLLGFIIGLQIGHVFTKFRFVTPKSMTLSSVVLLTMTLGLYHYLSYRHELYPTSSPDPNLSILMAVKWCEKKEWVHVSTTLLFSSMRYTGAIFGCALGLWGSYKSCNWGQRRPKMIIIFMAIFGLILGQIYNSVVYPNSPIVLYVSCFCATCFLFVGYIYLVPKLVAKMFPPPPDKVLNIRKNK